MTLRKSAASSTVLVIGPTWEISPLGLGGYCGTSPNEGLSPKMPLKLQGIRIDPAPSLPCASGPKPIATAAAPPPEEPPGVRPYFQGLWVEPETRLVVSPFHPISGVLVLPSITVPDL